MTAKEYLSQARYLDSQINAKIKQVEQLNNLATSATSVLSGMPHNPNKATSKMADIVGKIVDLQAEINHDIDTLVDLKREIGVLIKAIPSLSRAKLSHLMDAETWMNANKAIELGFADDVLADDKKAAPKVEA